MEDKRKINGKYLSNDKMEYVVSDEGTGSPNDEHMRVASYRTQADTQTQLITAEDGAKKFSYESSLTSDGHTILDVTTTDSKTGKLTGYYIKFNPAGGVTASYTYDESMKKTPISPLLAGKNIRESLERVLDKDEPMRAKLEQLDFAIHNNIRKMMPSGMETIAEIPDRPGSTPAGAKSSAARGK